MEFKENDFKECIKPHIKRCRDGDWNHAKRVVNWVKELGKGRDDLYLFIIAAYIHDIGWRDVLPPQKLTFNKLLEYEEIANNNSESYIKELLSDLNYSEDEIDFVLKLVQAADAHESSSEVGAIMVDADNLSKLNIDHIREKYLPEEWLNIHKLWEGKLPQRIKTEYGKEIYLNLLKELKDDINNSS